MAVVSAALADAPRYWIDVVAGGGAAAASAASGAASEFAVVVSGRGFVSTTEIGFKHLISLGGCWCWRWLTV